MDTPTDPPRCRHHFAACLTAIAFPLVAIPSLLAQDEDPPAEKPEVHKTVGSGFLGIQMQPSLLRQGGDSQTVIEIAQIVPGSAAEKAGLKVGDQIIAVDGKSFKVLSAAATDFAEHISSHFPGDTVELTFRRGEDEKAIQVELGERPETLRRAPREEPLPPVIPLAPLVRKPQEIEVLPPHEAPQKERSFTKRIRERESATRTERIRPGERPPTDLAERRRTTIFELQRAEPAEPRRPQPGTLEALANRRQAVRDAKSADEQLAELVAYCVDLTRDEPEDSARFDRIRIRFHDADFNPLSPRQNAGDIAKTKAVSVLFIDRQDGLSRANGQVEAPVVEQLIFRPVDPSVVKRLTNFRSRLYSLFRD